MKITSKITNEYRNCNSNSTTNGNRSNDNRAIVAWTWYSWLRSAIAGIGCSCTGSCCGGAGLALVITYCFHWRQIAQEFYEVLRAISRIAGVAQTNTEVRMWWGAHPEEREGEDQCLESHCCLTHTSKFSPSCCVRCLFWLIRLRRHTVLVSLLSWTGSIKN